MNILDFDIYKIEVLCFFILLIYGINFYLGKRANEKLANDWLDSVRQVIADNFGIVGSVNHVTKASQVTYE